MELVKVGKLFKPFGVAGLIKYDIDDYAAAEVKQQDVWFLKLPDGDVPFFVEQLDDQTVKFEDIDSPESAKEISMKDIYVQRKHLTVSQDIEVNNPLFSGYLLIDDTSNNQVGIIDEILEFPEQVMASITIDSKGVLIPLVVDWVTNVDHDSKQLHMRLPEGIISSQIE